MMNDPRIAAKMKLLMDLKNHAGRGIAGIKDPEEEGSPGEEAGESPDQEALEAPGATPADVKAPVLDRNQTGEENLGSGDSSFTGADGEEVGKSMVGPDGQPAHENELLMQVLQDPGVRKLLGLDDEPGVAHGAPAMAHGMGGMMGKKP